MTILDELAAYAAERVKKDKEKVSEGEIQRLAEDAVNASAKGPLPSENAAGSTGDTAGASAASVNGFYEAVKKPGISFICEIKKASPSKGIIDPVFDYKRIAKDYNEAGADAVSCLTEPKWFLGSDEIFKEVRSIVESPMIRKDFVVDEYQIYQAKVMGADCVLLICALLDTETIRNYLKICGDLGLAALVEAHDEKEIDSAVNAGAKMIGVNNRNLKDFSVDIENAVRLRSLIPKDTLYVSESGVMTPQDAAALYTAGADAILVGEALMRAEDKKGFLSAMRSACE